MPRSTAEWVLGRGVAVGEQTLYVLTFTAAADGTAAGVTQVVGWSPDRVTSFMLPWEARALCFVSTPEPHLVFVSPYGDATVYTSDSAVEEMIDQSIEGPRGRGVLRDAQVIGAHVYAVGMGRQVYRREVGSNALTGARWVHRDAGAAVRVPSAEVVGFASIDGFAEDEIYAVGWGGEIWQFDGRRWLQISSPTNLKLEKVVCAGDGVAYAAGQAGTLLKGRGDRWAVVEHGATNDQFWGAAWYRDHLWLATSASVYVLAEDTLEPVSFGLDGDQTCRYLVVGDGTLWSIGAHHLIHTGDGLSWKQEFL